MHGSHCEKFVRRSLCCFPHFSEASFASRRDVREKAPQGRFVYAKEKAFSAPMMWVKENFQFFHFSSTRS
jgi:hypothetical protein